MDQRGAGHDCQTVAVDDYLGQACTLYFDLQSRQLVGLTHANPMSEGAEQIRVQFAQWQHVDGVLLPSQVIITDSSGEFIFNFRQVVLNSVDEEMFIVPDSLARAE